MCLFVYVDNVEFVDLNVGLSTNMVIELGAVGIHCRHGQLIKLSCPMSFI
jgi:hypothetical protein